MKDMCHHCGHILPPEICLQPFEVDCKLRFFHIGCFEAWYDTDIAVLRVEHDGTSFVTREPYTTEPGEEVTLHWETMKQGKYWTLKEFRGF